MRIVNARGIGAANQFLESPPAVSLGYNPELTGMEEKFSNIWHAWHDYLVNWTRDRAPKLLVILVLAFVFVRLLGLITRKLVALSEKGTVRGAVRSQQVRTITGVIRSVGVFLIVFFTGMSALKDAF